MFKDDRLISILSGIVLMAALGMIIQRSDMVVDYIEGREPLAAVPDRFDVAARETHRLDVLANDTGTEGRDAIAIDIARYPGCGAAEAVDGAIRYDAMDCTGVQTLSYRVGGRGSETEVEIAIADPAVPTPPIRRTRPDAVAEAEPAVPRPDLSASGLTAPDSDVATGPVAAPTVPVPQIGRPTLSGLGDSDVAPSIGDVASAAPAQPRRADPGSLAATAAAPGAASAPESVSAPTAGRAPGAISAGGAAEVARVQAGVSGTSSAAGDADDAPAGLFGVARRATTQAAPDPSRPAPAVSLDNLLAYAPAPAPAPDPVARSRGAAPSPVSGIANMPAGFAASPGGLSAPLAAAGADRPAASLSLARVDRSVNYGRGPAQLGGGESAGGLDAAIPRANPVRIGRDLSARVALADPTRGLGDVRSLGQTGSLAPVDTSLPTGLSGPNLRDASLLAAADPESADAALAEADSSAAADLAPMPRRRPVATDSTPTRTAAVDPAAGTGGNPATAGIQPATGPATRGDAPDRVAALQPQAAACATPPGLTVDPRPAGRTGLVIVSPCHAGSIAELRYSGLRLAIPLDATGRGAVEVLGFEDRAEAVLWFDGGDELGFDLPFVGMRRLNRVALVWDLPVVLDLHAFEFGADVNETGHVYPGNRRSFEEIRRGGGGFLTTYSAIGGIGQNMQVYSFWRRRGGTQGVIDLSVDYATRSREARAETCGTGIYAAPAFQVVRSEGGEMDRPINRRLSSIACNELGAGSALIEAAIDDVIVRGR